MFLVPLVIGLGVGLSRNLSANTRNTGIVLLLFWLAAFGFFLARYPLVLLVKARDAKAQGDSIYWSGIYLSIALVGGIVLVITTQVWWLVMIGIFTGGLLGIYLWLATQRKEMTVVGEWTAIASAALTAPGAYLAIARELDLIALMLYALNVLFFGGTVYYIKYKVREQPRITTATSDWRTRLFAARAPIIYTVTAILVAIVFALAGWLPTLAIVAMVVPLPKVFIGAVERPVHVNLPRLGIIEVAHSIAFLIFILLAFRW
jgi:hypothetical protein